MTEPPRRGPQVPIQLADYESTPLSRTEYIAAIVHLYRGELHRSISWRIRLDATTNWAILTTAGLLTFTFGQGQHSHWTLLLGLGLIAVFHGLEARRFRLWHVWRTRVRMIEENFYSPILRRDPVSPNRGWAQLVAEDLFHPTFKLSRLEALRARLVRNYWAVYGVIVIAWVAKVFFLRPDELSLHDCLASGSHLLPWWTGFLYLGGFLTVLVVIFLYRRNPSETEKAYFQDMNENDRVNLDF